MIKQFTFTDEPCIEIDLELTYRYHFDRGNRDGKPEDCWPSEEVSEIIPPDDYAGTIMAAFIAEGRQAIKRFEAKIKELEEEHAPREWMTEYMD